MGSCFARVLRLFTALAALSLLAACVGPPKFQASVPRLSEAAVIGRSALLDETNHMTDHLDTDKRQLYFQNQGGGGAAVGLLLGPLGVAANMGMIAGVTKGDVEQLRGKIAIDPQQVFEEVARQRGFALAQAPAKPAAARITPYMYIAKRDADSLVVASALLVETGDGATKWTGKYMYEQPELWPLASLARIDAAGTARLRASTAAGFDALLRYLAAETEEKVALEPKLTFRSLLVNPRFDFEMFGSLAGQEGDVVWIRSVGAVFAMPRSRAPYTLSKP